jgi:small subunit ribosomal protein S16
VAVKIKLKRMGKIREPYYRIIVADARTKRDGRAIEEIGKYHPKADPSFIEVNSDRAQHWLSVGAQPTDPVRKILEITGDWQKFKGLPGTEGTLRTAAARTDKKEIFAAALAETVADSASAPKGKGRSSAPKASDSARSDKPARGSKPKADAKDAAPSAAQGAAAPAAPEAAPPAAEAAPPAAEVAGADSGGADSGGADSGGADSGGAAASGSEG